MKFLWILLNQLAYVSLSKYLPYRDDCRSVRYGGTIKQAVCNTRIQLEYDKRHLVGRST